MFTEIFIVSYYRTSPDRGAEFQNCPLPFAAKYFGME